VHTGCTGVNYASREMSNCSPYRKIYNSARCGKHYVLSPSPSSPPPVPVSACPPATAGRSTFSHPVVPTVHPRERGPPLLSVASHPRAIVTIAANKFARARCTAVVLTSERRQRALPEIHFSASHRRCSATTSDVRDTRTPVRALPSPSRRPLPHLDNHASIARFARVGAARRLSSVRDHRASVRWPGRNIPAASATI